MATAALRLDAEHPWPGLAAFSEDDRGYFRGRAREAEELARLVRRERLTVLFGRSGLGKTSLLGAGLFPRLRDEQHLPVLLRIGYGEGIVPRDQVWRALAAAGAANHVEAPSPAADETLWEHFHRAGAGFWSARNRPLLPVLVFDQFEEIFTLGQESEVARAAAADFLGELACLVEDRVPDALRAALDADPAFAERIDFGRRGCKVVLSFREDYLAEVEGLRATMPSLMRNRYRLLPMNGLQAQEVVASGGALVDAEAGARIIGLAWRNRAEAPPAADYDRLEIDPALLSVICSELNLRRIAAGGRHIGADLVADAEREILGDFYERSFAGLDERVRAFVENELITEGGFRDSFAYDDALSRPGITRDALQRLVDGRLLRLDERFGVRRLELTHDVLTRVVKESRDARKAREAEAAAAERERKAQAAQRRNRIVFAGVLASALGAFALLAFALVSMNRAGNAKREAEDAKAVAAAASAAATESLAQAKAANAQAAAASAAAAVITANAADVARAAAGVAQAAALAKQEADAANLMLNIAATPPADVDRALLLAAEGMRLYGGDRLLPQVEQFGRLLSLQGYRRLLQMKAVARLQAASADGRWLAVVTERDEIAVIDTTRWRVARRWKAEGDGNVGAVAVSERGDWLAFARQSELVLWDLTNDRAGPRTRLSLFPRWLAFNANASVVAAADEHEVELWPVGARPARIGASATLTCTAFGASGKQIVRADSAQVSAFDIATRTLLWTRAAPHGGPVNYSADCTRATVVREGIGGRPIVDVYDTRAGEPLVNIDEFKAQRGDKVWVLPSQDGRAFAIHFPTGLQVWRFDPPERLATVDGAPSVRDLAMSADQRRFVTHRYNYSSTVYDVPGDVLRELPAPPGTDRTRPPQAPAFRFAAGSTLAVIPTDGEVPHNLWPVLALDPPSPMSIDGKPLLAEELEFNATGSAIAVAEASGGGIGLWTADPKQPMRRFKDANMGEFSPRGNLVALRLDDRSLQVLDVAKGYAVRRRIAAPADADIAASTLAISWDEHWLAAGMVDGSVVVYRLDRDRDPGQRLPGNTSEVHSIAFSPDGALIAAAAADGSVLVFRSDGSAPFRRLATKHDGAARRVAFGPDGRLLASGGDDRVAILHDLGSGQPVARFEDHPDAVTFVAFSTDAQVLLAGDAKGGRKVWDVAKRRALTELGTEASGTTSVALSVVSRRAAITRVDNTVTLRSWDAAALLKDTCELTGRSLSCVEWRQFFPDRPYHLTCPTYPTPPCR